MSKNLRRVVATAAIAAGVAALSPAVAQAKTVAPIEGDNIALAACFGAPGAGTTNVHAVPGNPNAATFSVSVPAAAGVNYEFRARYSFTDAAGKTVTTKAKVIDPSGVASSIPATLVGAKNVKIYRVDVVNTLLEQLAYTSDGVVGCD
jgi:hypothetical protein